MNFEKIVGSKWYNALDWIYKLMVLNLMTLLVPMLGAAIPFWIFMNTNSVIPLFISFFLVFNLFIPCFITNFHVIKMNYEEKSTGVFKLYVYDLWVYIKKTVLVNIITSIIVMILIYAGYVYWQLLNSETFVFDFLGSVYVIGFWVVFMCLLTITFAYLHLPPMLSYFRMSSWNYVKGSVYMTFRHFFTTLLFILLIISPILLVVLLMNGFSLSMWALFGISAPQFVMYILARPIYWNIAHNVTKMKEKDIYEFKGEDEHETRN